MITKLLVLGAVVYFFYNFFLKKSFFGAKGLTDKNKIEEVEDQYVEFEELD
jgi:hypothetical protein